MKRTRIEGILCGSKYDPLENLLALSLEVTAFNFAWHHPETLCIRMSLQRNKRNKEVYTNYPRGVNFPGSLIQLFENL